MASRAVCKRLIEELKGRKMEFVCPDKQEQFEEICAKKTFSEEDATFLLETVDIFRRNPGTKKMWIEGEMREVETQYLAD